MKIISRAAMIAVVLVGLGACASRQAPKTATSPTPEIAYEMGRDGVGRIEILSQEKAEYTPEAREAKVEGVVVLRVLFRSDGTITHLKVIKELPHGLTEKAIEAANKIKFKPAEKDGKPVSANAQLEFTFNLY
jgi:protein TonB